MAGVPPANTGLRSVGSQENLTARHRTSHGADGDVWQLQRAELHFEHTNSSLAPADRPDLRGCYFTNSDFFPTPVTSNLSRAREQATYSRFRSISTNARCAASSGCLTRTVSSGTVPSSTPITATARNWRPLHLCMVPIATRLLGGASSDSRLKLSRFAAFTARCARSLRMAFFLAKMAISPGRYPLATSLFNHSETTFTSAFTVPTTVISGSSPLSSDTEALVGSSHSTLAAMIWSALRRICSVMR